MASCSLQVFLIGTLVLISISRTAGGSKNKNRTLYIATLLPYPDPLFNPSWSEGPQVSVALELAKEQINNQTAILPDYNIELIQGNSGCQFTTEAYEAVVSNVYSPAEKAVIGIIGPGCSSSSVAITALSSREELSMVTVHGGGSPLLSDRTTKPYAIGVLGSSESFAAVAVQIMLKHKWRRIGALFDESRLFYTTTIKKIETVLSRLNETAETIIPSIGFLSPVYDWFIPLSVIVSEGLRVNLLLTPVSTTQRIVCLAYHRGMVYPYYQWIIVSNTFEEVATEVSFYFKRKEYNCSAAEMRNVGLNRTFFFNYKLSPINETAPSTYSKYSFTEYDQIFKDKIEQSNLTYSIWTTYFYDSLWAWAVVLDGLSQKGIDLTQYRYGNTLLSDMLLEGFYGLDFSGVSGRIKFNRESGFLLRQTSVFQVVNSTALLVAFNDENGLIKVTPFEYIPDQFPDEFNERNPKLLAAFVAITILQLVVLVIFHALTIKYRHYPSVKATSLKLNQIMYVGCYLFILTLFLYIANIGYQVFNDPVTEIMCNLHWAWLFPFSFTLTFGAVAVRTWRLYRIFTHYLNPGRFIADHYLMAFVFILLGVDVLLGTLWVFIDPQKLVVNHFTQIDGVRKYDILMRLCESQISPWWSRGLVLGYRVVLMLVVLVLAFLTRNIQNQSFTTKTLRALVFLFTIDTLMGFLLYFLFRLQAPLSPLSFSAIVIALHIMLFLFVSLVFLPPLLPKFKEELVMKCFPTKKQNFLNDSESEISSAERTDVIYL